MKIISADYILTCNDKFEILKNKAICFDEIILDIDKREILEEKYPEAEVINLPKNHLIMPGLINPHVHLEFSSNKGILNFGSFIGWLNSVIQKRENLLSICNDEVINKQLKLMLKTGTTTIGAISSFGKDFNACKNSSQRVFFFNEILGSRPDSVDILFEDFKHRLRVCEDNEDDRLIPAISIHSPYSTHPILAKNALDIAKKRGYIVSTHFMESKAERDWIDSANGEFREFFDNFDKNAKPMINPIKYIEQFKDIKTLFTHCVFANKEEIEKIKELNGYITHCPVSNRLLGSDRLEIEDIPQDMLTLGTDGLSSNNSLSLWDEMRMALMMHFKGDLNKLASLLLKMSTCNAANALSLNAGIIQKGKLADFIVCEVPSEENLALNLILYTKFAKQVYIAGDEI
ncbi:metal-dependent hydrolase [Sulfurospirillum sp. 1307]